MYKSESRGERAINGSASEAEAAALWKLPDELELKILVCIQYMYSYMVIQVDPFYKQGIIIFSKESDFWDQKLKENEIPFF